MLIESLQYVLTTDAGMVALLGTPAARSDSKNGVFPTQAPDQPSMPYVVVSQVSGEPLQTSMAGTGCLTTERWRFSCCGTTYKSAKVLGKTVRGLMIGLLGLQTKGNCFVQGSWAKMEADESENLGKGTMYSTHQDFEIIYQDFDSQS